MPDIEAQQSPTQMTYSDDPSDMTADYLKAATKLPKNVDNPIVSENDRKYRKTLQLTSEQIVRQFSEIFFSTFLMWKI